MDSKPNDFPAIIFDLGGVLLNLDIARTEKAFQRLGMRDLRTIYSQAAQTGLFDDYETGRMDSDTFRAEMRAFLPNGASDQQIDEAWNAMLLDLPVGRIRLLEQLRKTKKIFLLSNTNEIHMNAYREYMRRTFGFPDLSHIFIKQYLSYEIGMRKPDRQVFSRVVEEHELDPAQTLFIDDSIQHVEGARSAGLQSIHLTGGKTILDLF